MAPSEHETVSPARRPAIGLSFGDGFQFGCGFFAAGLVVGLVLLLILLLVGFLLSLTGFKLLPNLLGNGVFLPLLA